MGYAQSQQERYGRGGIISRNRNTDWERAAEIEEERLRTTGTWGRRRPPVPDWGVALRRQDRFQEEDKVNENDEEQNWIRTINAALERSDYERMGLVDHNVGSSWNSPYGDSTGPMGRFERNMDIISPGWRNQDRVRQRDMEPQNENATSTNRRRVRRAILQDDETDRQERKEDSKENRPPE